ncbi:hypothetical protein GF380_02005 [Candidatus Uhrbacteria bacterium]|nr:hypothetical protein [Candidatus Uhrbacteria bacterium]
MKITSLRWIARVISILTIGCFLMFSLDEPIFSIGFLIHNIPTILLAMALTVAWNNEQLGGALFIILAFGTIFQFNTYRELPSFLIITLPLLLIGSLFFISTALEPKPTKPHAHQA